MTMHMIKLVVGVDTLDEFLDIQQTCIMDYNGQPANVVHTRFRPKREAEVLDGGSIYRVIKNKICCRQKILGFETLENTEKGTQTLIMVEPIIIQTISTAKRPFQGWRYFEPAAVPKDRGIYLGDGQRDEIPEDMEASLREAGLL